ncbi:DUF6907 domain-containing protein [Streptomyces sp. NPDC090493]|uniref:DUF6907 domain-containing protein n=1 Tax=Streptomyces sp. NPDC090493 TaxID=3365964 RepID=UPI0037FA06B8
MDQRITSGVSMSTLAIEDQSIAALFHVEVMHDLDTGEPTLIASTQPHHGDLQVVTADQVRAKATEVRHTIAQGEALAAAFEAATTAPAEAPRTWQYTNRFSGERGSVTCMTGCRFDHADDDTPTAPEDIYCWSEPNRSDASVPVDPDKGRPENFSVLSGYIAVTPFGSQIAERLPHAVVEILDQHYVTPLDPDALASFIDLLASRVDGLRAVHAELVRTRAEYVGRSGVTA